MPDSFIVAPIIVIALLAVLAVPIIVGTGLRRNARRYPAAKRATDCAAVLNMLGREVDETVFRETAFPPRLTLRQAAQPTSRPAPIRHKLGKVG